MTPPQAEGIMLIMNSHSFLLLLLSLILAACSSNVMVPISDPPAPSLPPTSSPQDPAATPTPPAESSETLPTEDLTQIDEQGMVTVEVTPLNLSNPGDTLAFEVALNTHSVDLSMDLAPLSTLNFGNGTSLPASLWDATRGGHHVSGKLVFPALLNGRPVLENAGDIQLVIKDLDAPERIFSWKLDP
jgi:hypothetical protein